MQDENQQAQSSQDELASEQNPENIQSDNTGQTSNDDKEDNNK